MADCSTVPDCFGGVVSFAAATSLSVNGGVGDATLGISLNIFGDGCDFLTVCKDAPALECLDPTTSSTPSCPADIEGGLVPCCNFIRLRNMSSLFHGGRWSRSLSTLLPFSSRELLLATGLVGWVLTRGRGCTNNGASALTTLVLAEEENAVLARESDLLLGRCCGSKAEGLDCSSPLVIAALVLVASKDFLHCCVSALLLLAVDAAGLLFLEEISPASDPNEPHFVFTADVEAAGRNLGEGGCVCGGTPFATGVPALLLSGRGVLSAAVVLLPPVALKAVLPDEGPRRRVGTSMVSDSNDARFDFTVDEVIDAGDASGAGRGAGCMAPPEKDLAMAVTLLLCGSGLVGRCPSGLQGRSLAGSGEVGRPLAARCFSTMALFQGGKELK